MINIRSIVAALALVLTSCALPALAGLPALDTTACAGGVVTACPHANLNLQPALTETINSPTFSTSGAGGFAVLVNEFHNTQGVTATVTATLTGVTLVSRVAQQVGPTTLSGSSTIFYGTSSGPLSSVVAHATATVNQGTIVQLDILVVPYTPGGTIATASAVGANGTSSTTSVAVPATATNSVTLAAMTDYVNANARTATSGSIAYQDNNVSYGVTCWFMFNSAVSGGFQVLSASPASATSNWSGVAIEIDGTGGVAATGLGNLTQIGVGQ